MYSIQDLIQLTQNALATLQDQRTQAFASGRILDVANFDTQIATAQITLNQLLLAQQQPS